MSKAPWSGRELHFIAIGGAGMSGLALIAAELGASVTGSDRAASSYTQRLRARGIEPAIGHDPQLVPPGAEVVISTAIRDDNPELERARERGQRIIHRGELLAEACGLRRLLAVSGTHGKTTTAGMIAYAWRRAGEDVGFAIGGELPGAGPDGGPANAAWGNSEWFVAEADESDASFLELSPEVAVVTNVELDHHARWSSRGELIEAFTRFAVPARAVVLVSDPSLAPIGSTASRHIFDPAGAGELAGLLTIPGRHNLSNATAALAAIELAGGPVDSAREALSSFPGIVRRMEAKGEGPHGALVYDDYAHHPTEVRATLAAAREIDGSRVLAIFQPHLYSRTKELAEQFGRALAEADVVGVCDVYPAREEPVGELAGVSGLDIARAAADAGGGRPVWWLPRLEDAIARLRVTLRSGDVILTIGAGDVYRVADALVADKKPGGGSG